MADKKKYTLEGDLREAANELQCARYPGDDMKPYLVELQSRLRKWADGKDPNEPDVDLRGIKVGDEVTFEHGRVALTTYVNHDSSLRADVDVVISVESKVGGNHYHYDGLPHYHDRPRIISYRTPPFDFQRSYDRGVRRFVKRDGDTKEIHRFDSVSTDRPFRDHLGNAWNSAGLFRGGIFSFGGNVQWGSEHPTDLIAEAPAEVQQEGQCDD